MRTTSTNTLETASAQRPETTLHHDDHGPSRAPGPAGTIDELADYLREGESGLQQKFNLGASGRYANDGVLEYNLSGFFERLGITDSNGISAARANLVYESLKLFEEVLGIEFRETTSNDADLFFSDNKGGAFASWTGSGDTTNFAVVNVDDSWSGGTSTYDDYALQTISHEIGHALGLGHQGPYNGSASFGSSAAFANDSWQLSMMSYFSQSENPNVTASFEYLQTPMAVDWKALDDLYRPDTGGVSNAFQGDTIYGVGTNIGSDISDIWANYSTYAGRTASTIVDASGNDTLDVSNFSVDQRIDLSVTSENNTFATSSDVGGGLENLTLAVGTVIENAIGGSGNDSIVGNEAANKLWGGRGRDLIFGGRGEDVLRGGNAKDKLRGNQDADLLLGQNGADALRGGFGNDRLFGGNGADKLAGGKGEDTLNGGIGDDLFVIAGDHGADRITDFMPGEDLIKLAIDGLSYNALVFQEIGAGTRIDTGDGTITLTGLEPGELSAEDFLFL